MNRLRRIGRQSQTVEDKDNRREAEAAAPPTEAPAEAAPSEAASANGVSVVEAQTEAAPEAALASPVEEVPAATAEAEEGEAPLSEAEVAPAESSDLETGAAAVALEQETREPQMAAELSQPEEVVEAAAIPEAMESAEAVQAVEGVEGVETEAPTEEQVERGTAPLAGVEREELTPLPSNAVVASKYVVQSQLHHSADRNLYRVAARRQQKCAACGRLSSSEADTCDYCGTTLQNQPPAEFYLMAESFQPESLMRDPGLMDLRLYHPNLVPVVDFFNYTPFGRMRYYAVAEPRQGVRLSQMSMPRPAVQVFGWALQLADALDYLHSRGVIGAGAEADDILVQGDMASLASLQNARVSAEDDPERVQQQSFDLAKLAATIYEAYSGQPATMSPEGMLPMPAQAPDKVVAAFRAALEPVQNIAPPISAGQWRDMISAALLAVAEMEQPGRPVEFVSASMTSVGRLREQNQDSFATVEFQQASEERPMKLGLYVVADGMGGHKGGEIASAIAAQVFCGEVMARVMAPLTASTAARPALTNEAIVQGLTRAVQSANERIYKARDSRQNDMGTTLVAAVVAAGKAYIINVGDSRFYFYTKRESNTPAHAPGLGATAPLAPGTAPLKKGTIILEEKAPAEQDTAPYQIQPDEYVLTQVSVDHSLVHRLVELGQLDPEEAKVHPHRNFIYRSLGGPPPIDVDTFVRTLHPGDRLLLCSDGLNSMIEDADIEAVLTSEPDAEAACRRLIELANEAGGHDNITTIIVDVKDYAPVLEHPDVLD